MEETRWEGKNFSEVVAPQKEEEDEEEEMILLRCISYIVSFNDMFRL
jgi:hypothetical protein